MSNITLIQASDLITDSSAVINNNVTALNNEKIETSYLDTDTSLTANSDTKIATQKAVKAYVDLGGNQNASETTRGIVQEATDAQVTAGTATGSTGAKLFVTPAKLATRTNAVLATIVSPTKIVDTFVTATAVSAGSSATTTTTIYTKVFPAGYFTISNGLKIKNAFTTTLNSGNSSSSWVISVKLNGTTVVSYSQSSANGDANNPNINSSCNAEFFILNNASLSSQRIISDVINLPTATHVSAYYLIRGWEHGTVSTSAKDTSGETTLIVEFSVTGGSLGSASMTNKSIIIEAISS